MADVSQSPGDAAIINWIDDELKRRDLQRSQTLIHLLKELLKKKEKELSENLSEEGMLNPEERLHRSMSERNETFKKVQHYFEQTVPAYLEPVPGEDLDNELCSLITNALMSTHSSGYKLLADGIVNICKERGNIKPNSMEADVISAVKKNFISALGSKGKKVEEELSHWLEFLHMGDEKMSDKTDQRNVLEAVNLVKFTFVQSQWKNGCLIPHLAKEFKEHTRKLETYSYLTGLNTFREQSVAIITEMLLAACPVIPLILKNYDRSYHTVASSTTKEDMEKGEMVHCSPYLYFYLYGKPAHLEKATVYFKRVSNVVDQRPTAMPCIAMAMDPKYPEKVCEEIWKLFCSCCELSPGREWMKFLPTLVENFCDLFEKGVSRLKKCLSEQPVQRQDLSQQLWDCFQKPDKTVSYFWGTGTTLYSEARGHKRDTEDSNGILNKLSHLFKDNYVKPAVQKEATKHMEKLEKQSSDYLHRPSKDARQLWEDKTPLLIVEMMFCCPPIKPICHKSETMYRKFDNSCLVKVSKVSLQTKLQTRAVSNVLNPRSIPASRQPHLHGCNSSARYLTPVVMDVKMKKVYMGALVN